MGIEPNQPDTAIDKTLAALNSAAPPEGLEARITARIAQRLEQPAPNRPLRDLVTGYTLPAAWWRGAATGAALALLAVAAVLLLQHKTPPPSRIAVTTNAPAPAGMPVKANESAVTPCAQPAVFHPRTPAPPAVETASSSHSGSPASSARWGSHPIPSGPLTAQERELIRLAQTADPKVLATFNSEHQAQLEAENAAQFEKFFTPPSRPPAPPDQPAANPSANPEATPSPIQETSPVINN